PVWVVAPAEVGRGFAKMGSPSYRRDSRSPKSARRLPPAQQKTPGLATGGCGGLYFCWRPGQLDRRTLFRGASALIRVSYAGTFSAGLVLRSHVTPNACRACLKAFDASLRCIVIMAYST